jgi:uroporphyrinogen decarboxylase
MTPKERWLAVLNREKPDRLPMAYWATGETTQKMLAHLECNTEDEMFERLHIDKLAGVGPKYIGPPTPEGEDQFGCRFELIDYGGGVYSECVYHPLAQYETLDEIKADYTWPSPDWYDYSHLKDQVEGNEDYPIQGGGSEPFLTYKNRRGMEQAFVDLILEPEIVHFCLDKLFGLAYETTRRIFEQIPGKVNLSYVAEDFGSQEDLMYSPEHIREFFVPRMKRMIELVHQAGAHVIHHSDGAVRKILPDMIEIGIDILNPIQWKCSGMDREWLKRDFGDKVVFHGGVDNQYTLPFGSEDEVRQEVKDNIKLLGPDGYILAPCHAMQVITPPENVIAMYETGYEYGKL